MKKLLFMVIGFMFAVSTAFASPSEKVGFTTMSKDDSQVLFGEHIEEVAVLQYSELKDTNGKYYWNRIDAYYYIRDYQETLKKLESNFYRNSPRYAMRERSRLFNIHQRIAKDFGIWLPSRSDQEPVIINYMDYNRHFR